MLISILLIEKIPMKKIYDYYRYTQEPLLVVSRETPKETILPPHIIRATLEPLSKTVINNWASTEKYSQHSKGGPKKETNEIMERWRKDKEWTYTHCISTLFKEGIDYLKWTREIAILVDIGYSTNEICDYYRALKD